MGHLKNILVIFRYLGNCPILNIPGFIHPVDSYYLDDFPKNVSLNLHKTWNSSNVDGM